MSDPFVDFDERVRAAIESNDDIEVDVDNDDDDDANVQGGRGWSMFADVPGSENYLEAGEEKLFNKIRSSLSAR